MKILNAAAKNRNVDREFVKQLNFNPNLGGLFRGSFCGGGGCKITHSV